MKIEFNIKMLNLIFMFALLSDLSFAVCIVVVGESGRVQPHADSDTRGDNDEQRVSEFHIYIIQKCE
jgi:hypothetical protein